MGIKFAYQRHKVQILGRRFQFEGQMELVGQPLDFLNSENRSTFGMYDVKIFPITPGGPLTAITRPEITVSNSELGLIFFLDQDYRQQVYVVKNFDRVIVYTPRAILRGNFHRGVEMRLEDLFEMAQGSYLAMTDVSVFLTTELPGPFPQHADLLVVNRQFVNLFHLE